MIKFTKNSLSTSYVHYSHQHITFSKLLSSFLVTVIKLIDFSNIFFAFLSLECTSCPLSQLCDNVILYIYKKKKKSKCETNF